ncbi:DUF551 domain-containing protein [Serratia sp. BW106]|uniref:DUF551 domain-containing protein n=1 Tax=Serratia sp. BW106 TaxID=1884636 RepID=UPI0012FE78E9|nr:DUF551 domain-containing protein [Serratia sp. BW106]
MTQTLTTERLREIASGNAFTCTQDDESVAMAAELLANRGAQPVAEYGDAYQGAREDLSIWKRRALEAEGKVRHLERVNDHLVKEAQGEHRMGEPVFTALPAPVVNPEFTGATAVPDISALTDLIVDRLIDCSAADDDSIADAETFVYNACRAAMLAQPVSQGVGQAELSGNSGGWIACKDRMPEPYEPVLYFAAGAHGGVDCCASNYNGFYDGDLWMQDATLTSLDESPALRHEIIVTHWMSLPAAPKVKK